MTPVVPILDSTVLAAFRSEVKIRSVGDSGVSMTRDSNSDGDMVGASKNRAPVILITTPHQLRGRAPFRCRLPDRHESHQLPTCPTCGGDLTLTGRTRTRLVEDIPDDLRPEFTEHTIHRYWCPCCRKQVPDALSNCTLGNRTVVLSAWLHYGLGVTTRQIVDVFNGHLRLPITDDGLTQMWHRLAAVLGAWYAQNQSERGAVTRGILMSVCRTLRNRGLDPLRAILDALRTYAATGTLPPMPEKDSSGG